MTVEQEILVMTALYLNHGTILLYSLSYLLIYIILRLGTKHGHINSLVKKYKDEELLKLRAEISARVYEDRATALDTPNFRTCIEEFREEFFRASKLIQSSVSKGDGRISSDILRRRSMETDMERMYRERVEKGEAEEDF